MSGGHFFQIAFLMVSLQHFCELPLFRSEYHEFLRGGTGWEGHLTRNTQLGGGFNSIIFYFHPDPWGNDPI